MPACPRRPESGSGLPRGGRCRNEPAHRREARPQRAPESATRSPRRDATGCPRSRSCRSPAPIRTAMRSPGPSTGKRAAARRRSIFMRPEPRGRPALAPGRARAGAAHSRPARGRYEGPHDPRGCRAAPARVLGIFTGRRRPHRPDRPPRQGGMGGAARRGGRRGTGRDRAGRTAAAPPPRPEAGPHRSSGWGAWATPARSA